MGEQWLDKNRDAAVPLYTPASIQCPWPPLSVNRLNVTTSGPFHFLKRPVNSAEIGDEILANIWLEWLPCWFRHGLLCWKPINNLCVV